MGKDILIIGATFTGIGAGYAAKERTLIVEPRQQVGYEFINSFNPGTGYGTMQLSPVADGIKTEMKSRGILVDDGRVHVPALAPMMFNRIQTDNIPVLLQAFVAESRPVAGGFETDIYTAAGYETIKSKFVLDTRPGKKVISKRINAMLCSAGGEFSASCGGVEYMGGALAGEVIMKLPVEINDDFSVARRKLHAFWEQRSDNLKPWTIAAVADCFEFAALKDVSTLCPGHFQISSCAFANPLEAFDAGYRFISGGAL